MKFRISDLEISRDDVFKNDKLGRREVVEFLANHISKVNAPYVIAIDAPYGSGKTTLVKMLQAHIDAESTRCIYVNLWEHDFSGDPLVPIIFALQEAGTNETSRKHLETAKRWAGAIVKHGAVAAVRAATFGALELDKDIEKVAADATGALTGDIVASFQAERKSIAAFKEAVEKAVSAGSNQDQKAALVLVIDELDRCRPSFAIETLERIKHLFNLENLIFVLALDKSQLEASVAAVYGERINAAEYLRKFFDIEFGMPVSADDGYTDALLDRFDLGEIFSTRKGASISHDRENFVKFFTAIADMYNLSLRARARGIARLCIVLNQTERNNYLDPALVALLLVIRSQDRPLFQKLAAGAVGSQAVVETIEALPQYASKRHSAILAAIEGYVLAGDLDESRREQRFQFLSAGTATASDDIGRRYEHSVRLFQSLVNGERGGIDLKAIMRKVDIAANIRR
jgi:energy-coupling factor transporter ATP-binding protein EcfA2